MKHLTLLYIVRALCFIIDGFYIFGWLGFIFFSKELVASAGYEKPPITINFIIGFICIVITTILVELMIKKERHQTKEK
jgi:uncharacterized membrane protein (DUF485 family)